MQHVASLTGEPRRWSRQSSQGAHVISTERARIQLDWLTWQLQRSYWAQGIPPEVVEGAVRGSWCFGLYEVREQAGASERQVGFARLVTDAATFAYLCDVIVGEEHRGRGLGTWLVKTVMSQPELEPLRLCLLGTHDAHELYRKFGFAEAPPGRFMGRRKAYI